MRLQSRMIALAASGALAVMAGVLPAGSASAANAGLQPSGRTGTALARLARPTLEAPGLRTLLHVRSCAYVRSHHAELARRGSRFAGCIQMRQPVKHVIARATAKLVTPGKSTAAAPGRLLGPADAGVGDCDNQPPGQWLLVDRTDECLQQSGAYLVFDLNTGQVIAGATISLGEEFELSTTFWDWDELVRVSMTNSFGDQAALDVQVAWVSTCTSPCTPLDASAFTGDWADLSPGQTVDGSLTMQASVPVNGQVSMPQGDQLIIYNPVSANQFTSTSWTDPYQVRCDDLIGEGGCVFPDFTPNLVLPESSYGASAAMVLWSQVNQGGWGLPYGGGPPLHYLADSGQQAQNRNVICYDGTFVSDPNVANDSCDEFPFASSYESGAMNGYVGSQCAEVEPTYDPNQGVWTVNDLNGIVNSGCTRGHVPLSQNQAVGGALGNFIVANRILDHDAYTVQVTAN